MEGTAEARRRARARRVKKRNQFSEEAQGRRDQLTTHSAMRVLVLTLLSCVAARQPYSSYLCAARPAVLLEVASATAAPPSSPPSAAPADAAADPADPADPAASASEAQDPAGIRGWGEPWAGRTGWQKDGGAAAALAQERRTQDLDGVAGAEAAAGAEGGEGAEGAGAEAAVVPAPKHPKSGEDCCHELQCAKCLACLANVEFYCYCKSHPHVEGCELTEDGWPSGQCASPNLRKCKKGKNCNKNKRGGASGASGASGESGASGAGGESGASGAADGGARGADGACCGDFEDVKCLACRAGIELKAFCKLNKHVHGC